MTLESFRPVPPEPDDRLGATGGSPVPSTRVEV